MNDLQRPQGFEAGARPDQDFDQQVDRLVDGELNEAERRQTLALCEERADGWRRCALAFLEAQAWRAEVNAIAPPMPALQTTPRHRANAQKRRPWAGAQSSGGWSWAPMAGGHWTLAASVLIAFAVGWLARPIAAPTWADAPETPPTRPLAEQLAPSTPFMDDDDSFGPLAPEAQETVTLVMNYGREGETRQIELPVLASTDENLAALGQSQPVVPAEVQAALLRIGHRVNERRKLMPLVLEDGRQLVVPVDEIEFTPVETPEYQ